MADKNEASSNPEAAGDLRGTLVRRLAVAGILVAVLLAVLAFFDYLANPEEPEAPVFTKPVPVPPKKEVTQPVTPTESLPEPPKPEVAPEKPAEPPPKPEVPAQPAAPAPEVRPEAKAPAKPAAPPVPTQPAAPKPAAPVPAPQPQFVKPAPAVQAPPPAATQAPVTRAPAEPKVAQPLAPRPPEAVPPAHQVPAPLRLFAGYVVQAGVFTSVQRAEELHAKLTLNGIPSTLEARVQAGPFKNRAEAAAAQEKMKALGIEAVLIPPKGGR
ncbi:MAG TPA: SPOR domain-containing protein [Rhodocyclaceae bacterium]|nr:SPOR domain-containing protein [Rhodocyclaceae bacterium]